MNDESVSEIRSTVYCEAFSLTQDFGQGIVRFSECEFEDEFIFERREFSFAVEFVNCRFHNDVRAHGATFRHQVVFNGCTFKTSGDDLIGSVLDFKDVTFFGEMCFLGANQVASKVYFEGCEFQAGLNAEGASFGRKVAFSKCISRSSTKIINCVFQSSLSLFGFVARSPSNVDFLRFDLSNFFGAVEFGAMDIGVGFSAIECKFTDVVDFGGSFFCGIFDLTRSSFQLVPNFVQTRFDSDPDISRTRFPFYADADKVSVSLEERYRALKRISMASENHNREVEFFDFEIRSRSRNGAPGKFYERVLDSGYRRLSNNGRSIAKPLWGLLFVFVVGFFLIYSLACWGYQVSVLPQCEEPERAMSAAIHSARSMAFIFGEFIFSEGNSTFRCVMVSEANSQTIHNFELAFHVHTFLLLLVSVLQGVSSILFVFLFTLGLRNRYRIL